MSKASLGSASNHDTTLQLTDFAAISAVVGPCFSFLATFYRIDPAGTMLVDNRSKNTSHTVSKASFESASKKCSFLNFTDLVAISAVVGPCFSFLATFYRIDPAETMLVNNRSKNTSHTLSKPSFESASKKCSFLNFTDLVAISAVVGPCFSFLALLFTVLIQRGQCW